MSRVAVAEGLRARRAEIEEAILTRVYTLADPPKFADTDYDRGLRTAVAVAIDHGIAMIEVGPDQIPPPPIALLAQARLAARAAVGLDTVLRRYLAGFNLLSDFLVGEAAEGAIDRGELKRTLRSLAAGLDRLIAAVSDDYFRETHCLRGSLEPRRASRVEGLLRGELVDTADLDYPFHGYHLGMVVVGGGAAERMQVLASALNCRLLTLCRDDGAMWAWLGGRTRVTASDLGHPGHGVQFSGLTLSIGEPGRGFAGWRLSHRQARAALQIAMRSAKPLTAYADVALLASVLENDLLATSLREMYLGPLARAREGGAALRETLRAYFAAERNVSSAAAALGVSRQTVINRLQATEERFERLLSSCAAEVEVALSLEEMDVPSPCRLPNG
ncbi:MAG TPA: helix-turn-helix domain-containing protein [Solirubrobacterales bacterium]|nr:helix-turn-helix domain-containing protein [Solirubrobacterales bacterium]